eukprot:m.108949 g.108949  ORF g.108949 m.108949 type:complete len:296 (-) comp19118_c0_seq3:24-911(-)
MAEFCLDVDAFREADDDPQLSFARALYAYTPRRGDELTLNEGDLVTVLRRGQNGWDKVVIAGHSGLVPDNYLEPCEGPPPQQHRPDRPRRNTNQMQRPTGRKTLFHVRALYPFTALADNQLTFTEGTVFKVLDDTTPEWTYVQNLSDAATGFVPSNYVERCAEPVDANAADAAPALSAAERDHSSQDLYATPEGIERESIACEEEPAVDPEQEKREECERLLATFNELQRKHAQLEEKIKKLDAEATDIHTKKANTERELQEYQAQIDSSASSQADVQNKLEGAKDRVRQILALC